jgi:succinoglycan biosynthesis protein ExoL
LTQIGYLAHDLTDPAVHRRLTMLDAGGACVAVAGLSRGDVDHPSALVLGRSADGKLARRAVQIGAVMAGQRARLVAHLREPDVLIARNLEMLALAVSILPRFRTRPRLVYECLDIHRLLSSPGAAGTALRGVERMLARHVDLVLTSSPAFVTHHLGRAFGDRVVLVENRVLELGAYPSGLPPPPPPSPLPGPPWRIGWFGALRCQQSLDILSEAARLAQGRIEVVIRGRPSPAIFPDLPAIVRDRPYLRFGGPYDPTQLAQLYAGVHFAWGVDLYEAGANSDWLLPNRLYESVHHGSVPIARLESEVGRFLTRHGIGLPLSDHSAPAVARRLGSLSAQDFRELLVRQRALPRGMWMADRADCIDLVRLLSGDGQPQEQRRVMT